MGQISGEPRSHHRDSPQEVKTNYRSQSVVNHRGLTTEDYQDRKKADGREGKEAAARDRENEKEEIAGGCEKGPERKSVIDLGRTHDQ